MTLTIRAARRRDDKHQSKFIVLEPNKKSANIPTQVPTFEQKVKG
jgi:hypothetical protein